MPVLDPTQSMIVQAAGNAVLPPAGTIVGQLANFFSIRGKTEHLSYPEADSQAHGAASQVQPLWKANLESLDYTFVAANYLPRVYDMLTAQTPVSRGKYGDWWEPGTLASNVRASNLSTTDVDARVNLAAFYHFFWIFFNEDVTRVKETFTRIWAAQVNVMFQDKPAFVSYVQQQTGGGTLPVPTVPKNDTNGLILAGAAGLAAFFLLGKPH